jgi:uncharacterized protein YbjT (DUF2867 family)
MRALLGPVLVTGAKGITGLRIVERLRLEGVEHRAASRTSETRFNWLDRETWKPALTGMRSVYLVPNGSPGPEAVEAFSKLAAELGVAIIVLISTREAEYAGYEKHLATEDAMIEGGTGWTILRPSWFSQNFYTQFDREVRSGLLELPAGEGRDPFVDADDIAEVAFQALTMHGLEDKVYDLSGPEPISFREATEKISALSGLTVRYNPISEGAYADRLSSMGLSDDQALEYATQFRPLAKGNNDYTSEGIRRLLGRPSKDFDTFVRETVAKRIWPPR